MSPNQDRPGPTFPIPSSRLQARKWKIALESPVTWAPYLPVVGAFAFLDVGVGWFAGLAAAVTAGIVTYWKGHHTKLEGKLIEDLVRESNEDQDKQLIKEVRFLQKNGHGNYATTLGSFLEKKQQVEKAIHSDGSNLTPEKKEIESLIDSIVFGVADQLHRLSQFDDRLDRPVIPLSDEQRIHLETSREEVAGRVHEAWNLINETWDNLGTLLNPAATLTGEDSSHLELDTAISRLKREHEIADRVRERMTTEWGAAFGEAEPISQESMPESESD
ncbi:MAG: hypothetical protein P1U58_15830 [Verrucomicrobiales bacterium]|nr:hypothetical protein [Verrucomicrobiales bacterium]